MKSFGATRKVYLGGLAKRCNLSDYIEDLSSVKCYSELHVQYKIKE